MNLAKNKPLLILAIILCMAVGYKIVLQLSRAGETAVNIIVLPDDSNVFINDQASDSGTTYLKPGTYKFTARREGFKDDSREIKIENEPVDVELLPSPNSDAAYQLIENDPDLQAQREVMGGRRAATSGLSREEQTPLIAFLPTTQVTGPFTINYGPSETRKDGVFLEIIDSSPEGRTNALKWIRERDQDPTDLEIRFLDFANPLVRTGAPL